MIRAFPRTLKRVVPQNSPRALFKSAATATTMLFTAAALLACTPAYDWRTIQNNDDAYEVTFPAKPRSDARDIDIAGKPICPRCRRALSTVAGKGRSVKDTPKVPPHDKPRGKSTRDRT